jgi:hypothetical protein
VIRAWAVLSGFSPALKARKKGARVRGKIVLAISALVVRMGFARTPSNYITNSEPGAAGLCAVWGLDSPQNG